MHFTLLVAGALLPAKLAAALSASLEAPNLKTRLSRATLIENVDHSHNATGNAHLDWLARKLFSQSSSAATAPYALAWISGEKPHAFVWHADPVHVEAARDHLVVQSLGTDAPMVDESAQLVAVANELLSTSDCEIVVYGDRWFMLSEHDWQIDAPSLASVDGASVTMPTGRDAQIWARLHNEVQMAWHAHSVNETRSAKGLPTINALWLSGGARWKPLPATEFSQVQCDAPEWPGAAHAAGSRGCPLEAKVNGNALVLIDDLVLPRRREDWAAWLQALNATDRKLSSYGHDAVDLVLAGSTIRTFASRPADRYKPWRRRSLAEALTE